MVLYGFKNVVSLQGFSLTTDIQIRLHDHVQLTMCIYNNTHSFEIYLEILE
jgi:hypothetical protein